MPFDCANYGSEVLRILRRARDRIASGQWTQGRLVARETHNTYKFCMMGAIVCNDDGQENRNEHTDAATMVVGDVLGVPTKLQCRVESTIVNRNDSTRTSHSDVESIMSAAVKLRE